MLTFPSVLLAVLPALSVHVAVACWAVPSAVIVFVPVGETGRDGLSVQFQVRVTSVVSPPLRFLAGLCPTNVMVGGVESSPSVKIVVEHAETLPAASFAVA